MEENKKHNLAPAMAPGQFRIILNYKQQAASFKQQAWQ